MAATRYNPFTGKMDYLGVDPEEYKKEIQQLNQELDSLTPITDEEINSLT